MQKRLASKKGFTLIEVLVVMAISMSVYLFSSFVLFSRQPQMSLDSATNELLSMMRLAQNQSITGYRGSSWGVYFDALDQGNYTIYAGDNYQARDELFSRVIELEEGITWRTDTGSIDIVFSPVNGFPGTSTELFLDHVGIAEKGRISINSLGKIERND